MLPIQIADLDIWFHLSIGREVVSNLSIPAYEFLVYPNAGNPGAFHEWGYGVLNYLSYQLAGFWGISILNALLGSTTLLFLYLAGRPARGDEPWHFIALLAVFACMEFRFVYRPEMILYLFLGIEIFLLERYLSDRHWKWLLPIPIAGFVLSQAHPSVIFMVAVLGAYLLQLLWEMRRNLRAALPAAGWFGFTTVITILLAAINPYGFEQVYLPFEFLGEGRVTRTVDEFRNVLQAGSYWTYFYLILTVAAGIALIVARNRRPLDWLLYVVFGYLAFAYVRNIGLFALMMCVPLSRGLADGAHRVLDLLQLSFPGISNRGAIFAAWAAAIVSLLIVLFTPVVVRPWGAGPAPMAFPETAVKVIKEVKPPGRIFNLYDLGGYLGWALDGEYQVFIDGRHYAANKALSVHYAVISGRQGWQRVLDRYDVSMIVTQGTFRVAGQLVPLVGILADDPGWVLAARGERALLFIRQEVAAALPARYQLGKEQVWQQVLLEANGVLERTPSSPMAYLARGEALLGLGQRELAIREFEMYLAMAPNDLDAAVRLQKLRTQP
jgi:hypothetical protein